MDKKAADEYDKMLDMADSLADMFSQAPKQLTEVLKDNIIEELSIYLAQNRDDVLIALQAKKAKPVAKKASMKVVADSNKANVKDIA
jgi:dsDNA-binding SOS-regulon protein